MAEICAALPELTGADPDYLANLSDYAVAMAWSTSDGDLMTYAIERGYHDCFDGCDCFELTTYAVWLDGRIELGDYQASGEAYCTSIPPTWEDGT